jgi:hypothetical protein
MWGALSDERMGLYYTHKLLLGPAKAVTLRSKCHSTHGHILLSLMRLPQPGGPGPRIYIPQEQGGYTPPKVKVTLRPTDHLGPETNFSISLRFSFTVTVCYVVAPSLTRGRVCNLL